MASMQGLFYVTFLVLVSVVITEGISIGGLKTAHKSSWPKNIVAYNEEKRRELQSELLQTIIAMPDDAERRFLLRLYLPLMESLPLSSELDDVVGKRSAFWRPMGGLAIESRLAMLRGKGGPNSAADSEANNVLRLKMATFTWIVLIPTIEDLLKNGKKALIHTDVKSKIIPVHCNLAASYGRGGMDGMSKLDINLKVMIMGTIRQLGRLSNPNWQNIVSTMMASPVLLPEFKSNEVRAGTYIAKDNGFFKFVGSPNKNIVAEVQSWFINLIQDQDVLDETKIDIDFLSALVGSSGVHIRSVLTFFYGESHIKRTLIDVGVLRYPDLDHSHFVIYRLKIVAWADSQRIIFGQKDSNGITGTFHKMTFNPRHALIDTIQGKYRAKAVLDIEDFLMNASKPKPKPKPKGK